MKQQEGVMFLSSYVDVWHNWKCMTGRMRRDRYWEAFAFNVFVIIMLTMLAYRVGGPFIYIEGAYYVVSMVPFFTASCRRLHDGNYSNWFQLLWLVPIIGWAVLFILLMWASNPETNKFGMNPYEAGYYHL